MSLMERARGLLDRAIAGARPYRFDGEQENHADQLRQTQVSLSMMVNADPNDPDQVRMATEIEDDQEKQLAELLNKPQLTLEQKRTRDAIQTALQARRQSFDAPVGLVAREDGGWRPQRFLGPLGPNLALYGAGAAVVAFVALLGWWRIDVALLKGQRDRGCTRSELQGETTRQPCTDLAGVNRELIIRTTERNVARLAIEDAQRASRASRAEAEAADRRASAAAARARRRTDALRQIDAGGPPPAWERSLRDDGATESGAAPAGGGDPAGGGRP